MFYVAAAIAIVQIGIGILGGQSAKRENKRAIRAQQRENNRGIIRAVRDSQKNFSKTAELQRVAFGGAGVRGGSTLGASLSIEQAKSLLLEQQRALRGINTNKAQSQAERDEFFSFISAVNRGSGRAQEGDIHGVRTQGASPVQRDPNLPAGLIAGTALAQRFLTRQSQQEASALTNSERAANLF